MRFLSRLQKAAFLFSLSPLPTSALFRRKAFTAVTDCKMKRYFSCDVEMNQNLRCSWAAYYAAPTVENHSCIKTDNALFGDFALLSAAPFRR